MLLYLVIYNPSLKGESKEDDEDAAEQAHVLFYTAREHAVSKDRVLRQVGLAKALVNFTAYVQNCSWTSCSSYIEKEECLTPNHFAILFTRKIGE